MKVIRLFLLSLTVYCWVHRVELLKNLVILLFSSKISYGSLHLFCGIFFIHFQMYLQFIIEVFLLDDFFHIF